MVIRHVMVALAAGAALLSGCDSADGGSAAPSPPTTTTVSDDDQIREVLHAVVDSGWDAAKTAELTCQKYRTDKAPYSDMVPPMETFASVDVSAIGTEKFAALMGEKFPGATPESLRAVAEAVMHNDQAAYTAAMTDVVSHTSKITLDKVDNIAVNGDTATADVTVTFTVAGQSPETQTTEVNLQREGGQWKDCTPPDSA